MDYQVVLSPSARADLRDIVRYISLDAPDRALRFGQFLVLHTKRLAQFPELGRWYPSSAMTLSAKLLFGHIELYIVLIMPSAWLR